MACSYCVDSSSTDYIQASPEIIANRLHRKPLHFSELLLVTPDYDRVRLEENIFLTRQFQALNQQLIKAAISDSYTRLNMIFCM